MSRGAAGLCAAVAALVLCSPLAAARPLQTAVAADSSFGGPEAALAFERTRAAGASRVRLTLSWAVVARRKPTNGVDPADPAYEWGRFDTEVRLALAHDLQPIVSIDNAPGWAEDRSAPLPFVPADPALRGPIRPDPDALARFARAASTRYGGSFSGLPRVRYWRVWNEPNLSSFLLPQLDGNRALSPDLYRRMLNESAAAIHSVHPDNVVVGGGLSPYATSTKLVQAVAPLRFMRQLLCMSRGSTPRPTCSKKVELDAWGVHPYTSGGPTRKAASRDDVSLGDLPAVRRLLDAAARAGHIVSRGPVRMWVTEFSWDTRPPDLNALVVPVKLHARWVSEALYQMWRSDVTLATWFQLRDDPYPTDFAQSGLYFRGGDSLTRDAPKPALAAFRFPFVAYRARGGVDVWGRTSAGRAAYVLVEENAGDGWRRLAKLRADRYGIFAGHIRALARVPLGARRPLPPRSTYRRAVLRDSPVSYWALDEQNGTTARDLAGVKEARYVGAKLGVPGALLGTPDRAVSLDGKNDAVSLGPIRSPATVEGWVKTETTRPVALFSNRDGASRYTYLGVTDPVHALAYDTGMGLRSAAWVTDGRWHYLVYTHDGISGRLYVDGRLDSSGTWPRVEGTAAASLGYDATLKTHLRGAVDEVALYDYPLTADQVRSHFLASGRGLGYADQFNIMGHGTYLRARIVGGPAASLPFSLARPHDRYVLPFGV